MEQNLTPKELSRRDLQRSLTNRYEKILKDRDTKHAENLAAKDKVIAGKDKDLRDKDVKYAEILEARCKEAYNRGWNNNSSGNWKFWTFLCCVVIAAQLGFGIYHGVSRNNTIQELKQDVESMRIFHDTVHYLVGRDDACANEIRRTYQFLRRR